MIEVTPAVVGTFVDSITIQHLDTPRRTTAAVAGRFIEEAVELCLATGMNPKDIMGHVMDSIHNQVGKAGRKAGRVIYPTYYTEEVSRANIAEEAADCAIILKDLSYVGGFNLEAAQSKKWEAFIERKFNVSETGTLYAIKKTD